MSHLAAVLSICVFIAQTSCTRKQEATPVVQESTPETQVTTATPEPSPMVAATPSESKPVVTEQKVEPKKQAKVASQPKTSKRVTSRISGSQVVSGAVTSEPMGPPSPTGSRLSGLLQASHAGLQKQADRSFSEFLIEGKYRMSSRSTIGLGQAAQKVYEVSHTGNEREFLLNDTRVFYSYFLGYGFMDSHWELEAGATLPVSQESRDNGHVTQPYLTVKAWRPLFSERLIVRAMPIAYYRFNNNATNQDGIPNQKMGLGGTAELEWVAGEKVSFIGFGKGTYRLYEEYDLKDDSPAGTGHFGYGAGLQWRISELFTAEAGFIHASSILRDVRYDSLFRDPETDRGYVTLGVTL